MSFTTDLRVPDPVSHMLHPHQIVTCVHRSGDLHYGYRYAIKAIVHDPQGDMVEVAGIDQPGFSGTFWIWRFAP